ncbi:MAG TPA: MASE3 domain-containing protein, partial [Nitrospirota bacterium]|nr:MASE3 domain-containing protein [Nitrospirota bacterium]
MLKNSGSSIKFLPVFFSAVVALGLYASSRYSYVLFHSLVELFSVLVAFMIFVLAWNTRRVQD